MDGNDDYDNLDNFEQRFLEDNDGNDDFEYRFMEDMMIITILMIFEHRFMEDMELGGLEQVPALSGRVLRWDMSIVIIIVMIMIMIISISK